MGVGAIDAAKAGEVRARPAALGTMTAPWNATPLAVPLKPGRKSAVLYLTSLSGGGWVQRGRKLSVSGRGSFPIFCGQSASGQSGPFLPGGLWLETIAGYR